MNSKLFENIQVLNERLAEHRKTSVLDFRSVEEKNLIKTVYKEIYPHVQTDLNCISCILSYLNNLQAWYAREYPKYIQSLPAADPAPQDKAADAMNDTYVEPIKPKKTRKKK